jgi:glutathione S-transferase
MTTKLYYAPGACSLASHIALEESGIPYETERLNLAQGDQRKPEYLKLNPNGKVPTLVVDGKILTENVAILTYVGGGYPNAGLWPKKTWEQAQALSLMAWLSNTVHTAYGRYFRPERFVGEEAAAETVKAKARESFEASLRQIDAHLEGRKWAASNHFTVVDGYLVVFYRWGNRAGLPVKSMKHYTRLVEEALGRPAVTKVMNDEGITLDK